MALSQGIASRPPAVAMRVVALCCSAVQYIGCDSYIAGVSRVSQAFRSLSNDCVTVCFRMKWLYLTKMCFCLNENLIVVANFYCIAI